MYQILQTSKMYLSALYFYLWILVTSTILAVPSLPSLFIFSEDGIICGHTNSCVAIVRDIANDVSAEINSAVNNTTDSADSFN